MKNARKTSGSALDVEMEKNKVDAYFDKESSNWNEIYHKNDVYSVIHQDRRSIAINYFEDLSLPLEARILEIGCGAGLTTVDIARRGYSVNAVDSVETMVDLTRHNALRFGVGKQVNTSVEDVHSLSFPDNSFHCVIALGVVPWLADVNTALREIFRVLVPGGHVIINMDNRYRLNHLLDPAHMPALAGFKERLRRLLENAGLKKPSEIPQTRRHTAKEFDNLLASVDLEKIKHRMIGFGPFSFLRVQLFPGRVGVMLHGVLQKASTRGIPLISSTGAQYLVVARKN